jgi:hypothetical protein
MEKQQHQVFLGHILYESGVDVTAFLGGIVENYNSNLIGSGKTLRLLKPMNLIVRFCICIQILLA